MAVPTALTSLLQIEHPIMCAGMGRITGAELAAAVSEAGGKAQATPFMPAQRTRNVLMWP